jgi:hypothetical protein
MMSIAVPAFLSGSTQGRILDVLVFGLAGVLAYRFPRTAPYLAVFSVGLQSTLTHSLTSEGDALAGLTVGLALTRIRSRHWPSRRVVSYTLLALVALGLLVGLSFAANGRGPYGNEVASGSEYFISRTVLAAAVLILSEQDADWQHRWVRAIALLALILSAFRIAEIAGLPIRPLTDALGIAMVSEYSRISDANIFAVVAAVGIPFLLAGGGSDDSRTIWQSWGRWLAAALVTFALASTESRTGVVIMVVVVSSLLFLAKTGRRRMMVLGLALIYAGSSLFPAFSIGNKPVVVSAQPVTSIVATNEAPIIAPPHLQSPGSPQPTPQPIPGQPKLPAITPQWRSLLDRTSYVLEATMPPAARGARGSYLVFVVRAASRANQATLRITVNKIVVADLQPSGMSPYYHWEQVPVPDALVDTGKPVTVGFTATGNVDSSNHYFAMGGIYARSSGYSSRIWTGHSWLQNDLSSDPGVQSGLLLVFLNGAVPPLEYFAASPSEVIDTSLSDRLVLWKTALIAFVHNPALGTGFYTFQFVQDKYEPGDSALFFAYTNAHSNYFELLSDLGVAGPILFLLILLVPLWKVARRSMSRANHLEWIAPALGLALIAFLLSSFTQTWIADSRLYITAWFIALIAGSEVALVPLRNESASKVVAVEPVVGR